MSFTITKQDAAILRENAKRYLELAQSPCNCSRRDLWYRHNDLQTHEPLVLIETVNVLEPLLEDYPMLCQTPFGREIERGFHWLMCHHEKIGDDQVLNPYYSIPYELQCSDYGVPVAQKTIYDSQGHVQAYHYDPPIQDLEEQFHLLRHRTFSCDKAPTLQKKQILEETFGDILPVQIRGAYWWSLGLTIEAIKLIGLENLMVFMIEQPEALHQLMAFLRDDHLHMVRWCQENDILPPNDEGDYVGSGSYGFTHLLPKSPDGKIRTENTWALLESQETVSVSPAMFREFVLPYQMELGKEFGLVYYGCCEPLESRWDYIKEIENLHTVSISPWCQEEPMAQALQDHYVYARKPNPNLISYDFDEDALRKSVRHTLELTKDCCPEIVMKDVHTVQGDYTRMRRYVELVRQEISRING